MNRTHGVFVDHEGQPPEGPNGVLIPFQRDGRKASFPNVVFGVTPAILKELNDQLEKFIRSTSPERLMAESDTPMVGKRRVTNHPCAGPVLKRVAAINGFPLPIMRKICESRFHRLFGRTK